MKDSFLSFCPQLVLCQLFYVLSFVLNIIQADYLSEKPLWSFC